jgi:citryl-CoA lyase
MDSPEKWPDPRRWVSSVADVGDDEIYLRGYPHTQIIRNLSFAQSFYLMVRGELPTPQQENMMNALLCAVPDVGLMKPGTVAARIAASGNPSMNAGLAVAFLSAGANTLDPFDAANFIEMLCQRFKTGSEGLDQFAEAIVDELKGQRIPGFGHPFFEYFDPRSVALREVAAKNGLLTDKLEVYEAVHRAFIKRPGKAALPINDVGMSAAILLGMGFTPHEMTGVLLTSTLPGLVAHLSEELRQGVRIRVVDERLQRYDGVPPRELPTKA